MIEDLDNDLDPDSRSPDSRSKEAKTTIRNSGIQDTFMQILCKFYANFMVTLGTTWTMKRKKVGASMILHSNFVIFVCAHHLFTS